MRSEPFDRLGMADTELEFDEGGTWFGGTGFAATMHDFARFGLLYLRDGVWDGERVLPEGWVDYTRTPSPTNPEYGAHWWLDLLRPRGAVRRRAGRADDHGRSGQRPRDRANRHRRQGLVAPHRGHPRRLGGVTGERETTSGLGRRPEPAADVTMSHPGHDRGQSRSGVDQLMKTTKTSVPNPNSHHHSSAISAATGPAGSREPPDGVSPDEAMGIAQVLDQGSTQTLPVLRLCGPEGC